MMIDNLSIKEKLDHISSIKCRMNDVITMIEAMKTLYDIHSTTNTRLINKILEKYENDVIDHV